MKNDEQADVYGKMAAVSGIGIALGPMIGGHISEDNPESGFSIACSVACLLFIFNAGKLVLLFILTVEVY